MTSLQNLPNLLAIPLTSIVYCYLFIYFALSFLLSVGVYIPVWQDVSRPKVTQSLTGLSKARVLKHWRCVGNPPITRVGYREFDNTHNNTGLSSLCSQLTMLWKISFVSTHYKRLHFIPKQVCVLVIFRRIPIVSGSIWFWFICLELHSCPAVPLLKMFFK